MPKYFNLNLTVVTFIFRSLKKIKKILKLIQRWEGNWGTNHLTYFIIGKRRGAIFFLPSSHNLYLSCETKIRLLYSIHEKSVIFTSNTTKTSYWKLKGQIIILFIFQDKLPWLYNNMSVLLSPLWPCNAIPPTLSIVMASLWIAMPLVMMNILRTDSQTY